MRYHFSACSAQEGARGSDECVQTNRDTEDVNTSHTCRVQGRTPVTGFTVRLIIISQRATSTPRYKLQSRHEHPTIQAAVTPRAPPDTSCSHARSTPRYKLQSREEHPPDTSCSHATSTPRYKLQSRHENFQIQVAVTPGAPPDTSCSHATSTPRYKLQSRHEHPQIQAAVTPGAPPDTSCRHTRSTPRYKLQPLAAENEDSATHSGSSVGPNDSEIKQDQIVVISYSVSTSTCYVSSSLIDSS